MQSKATTVAAYLRDLPPDRRAAISALREVMLGNLDRGFEEGMQYGMIGYFVPHSIYPAGYHCDPRQPLPFAALASQKNHMAVYLMSIYADPVEERWLREQWARAGKKLDMGKCCVRFRGLDDVPLDVLGAAIKRISLKRHIEHYESVFRAMSKRASATRARPAAARATPGGKKKAGRKTKGALKPARRSAARRSR